MRHISLYILAILPMALSAGEVGNLNQPAILLADSLPSTWDIASDQLQQTLPSEDKWWQEFDDPVLNDLIARGEQNSYDLQMALRRIDMADLTMKQAKSAYFPTINAQAGWTGSRMSGVIDNHFNLGLSMSWEIDVFGRVKANLKQAEASRSVSQAQYTGAMVSLSSNIATVYFQLRMYQAELEVAKAHIASQEHIVKMTEARHDAGLVSGLDVHQARTVLYSTQASVPQLEGMIKSSINTLAILVGDWPEEWEQRLATPTELPNCYRMIQTGVPADLLRRRPDLVQAEAEMAEYAAMLGVAKKDFLPTLSLTGFIGVQHREIDKMFTKDGFTYSIAPQLSWTLFDGMSRKYNIASAREQMMLGIDNYNATVLTAYKEADNAMVSYETSLQTIELDRKVIAESQQAYDMAVDMYRQGLTPFSNVVDAQMTLLQYEDALVQARGAALANLVNLYQALGGGY